LKTESERQVKQAIPEARRGVEEGSPKDNKHHMKRTLHKPDDCDLGKKQQAGNQGNNNSQNDRPRDMANQATYTELLAQLSLRSANE
jgi:hypothetical protein